jgi:hypothetical protein
MFRSSQATSFRGGTALPILLLQPTEARQKPQLRSHLLLYRVQVPIRSFKKAEPKADMLNMQYCSSSSTLKQRCMQTSCQVPSQHCSSSLQEGSAAAMTAWEGWALYGKDSSLQDSLDNHMPDYSLSKTPADQKSSSLLLNVSSYI